MTGELVRIQTPCLDGARAADVEPSGLTVDGAKAAGCPDDRRAF